MIPASRGEVLAGRYRVDEQIGEGGMGQVWRGLDLQLGRAVAIKVFSPHMMARPDAVARFEREARVGAALGHPNVVHTFDFGCHDGRWFLIMQLIAGANLLAYRVHHAPISTARILGFGGQLADALAATHAIGLVHRDLKPENVLVEETDGGPLLRVADFGMAYLMAPTDARQGRLTADGLFGGTPEYMAPEQIAGDPVGPPADIYALGCVLFELALGHTPFQDPGVGKVFAGHLYAPPPRISATRDDLPAGFDELVQRMLDKSPGERPTADIVRRRLATMSATGSDAAARYGSVVSDRAARMVPASAPAPAAAPCSGKIELAGELDRDARIAIAAAGLTVIEPRSGVQPDVRLVLGASLEQIAHACSDGIPVVADAPRGDFQRISGLLRLGVADVVLVPLVPSSIVRGLLRVLRKTPELQG